MYETGVLALADGRHIDWALNFFDMLLENHPDSRYAPAACVTKLGIYLGHMRANRVLIDTLMTGSELAPTETRSSYTSAISSLEEQNAHYLNDLEESYELYDSKYSEVVVSLQLGFRDISGDIAAVREDLGKLGGGSWIPLIISPFQHVRLLYTYSSLLEITGVDFSDRSLESWLQGEDVERVLVKEAFFFQLGSLFSAEGRQELAVDALQQVVHFTQYQLYSEFRAEAIALLEDMGVIPDTNGDGSPKDSPGSSPREASPTGERPSILFDETRLVIRPTGEKNSRISDLSWYGCSDLAALLRTNGFDVGSLDSGLITFSELARYDTFAILTTDHNYPYSFIEVLAIAAYVEAGGGLLICESTWSGGQQRDYTAGYLASDFGVGFIGNGLIVDLRQTPGVVQIDHTVPHDMTEGVTSFSLVEAAYLDVIGRSTALAYSPADSWFDISIMPKKGEKEDGEPGGSLPVLAALDAGEGRVVFLADGMLLANGWLDDMDNTQLALNIFAWLMREK
ncbi:MAG: hypothetical protein E4G89_06825 [Methanothrix sp.]|nr:MAG: hypothetical protein E4G89_06825 [Methanothrix sp.]